MDRLRYAETMQPLMNGLMLGGAAGLTLAVVNVTTKTLFGTGWIDWTVGNVGGGQ